MDENTPRSGEQSAETKRVRCPHCDTLNNSSAKRCIGCGKQLSGDDDTPTKPKSKSKPQTKKAVDQLEPIKDPKTQAAALDVPGLLLKIATLLIVGVAIWTAVIIRRQNAATQAAEAIVFKTATPNLADVTNAPGSGFSSLVATRTPTIQPVATETATATPTLVPTPTLQPPRGHTIASGEALFNIALRYGVSMQSIIDINPGLAPERIVSGTTIQVPMPTATPPLEPILIDTGEERLLADPTDCIEHVIQEAETLFGIAGLYGVPIDALLLMNRLSAEVVVSPGDTVCIPTIVYNAVSLDDAEVVPVGERNILRPRLLYPAENATISADKSHISVQWLAERNLEQNEFYMVEITNLSDPDSRPRRAFTQQTSFQFQPEWDETPTSATFRWRVSYVWITGERQDGDFVYAYGGPSSEASFIVAAE